MTKRLFIFAGYDRDNIVDETLLHYINALSNMGDIIFTMDNDTRDSELDKIRAIPNVLHAMAVRHGEYDFGSYKRGYIWALDSKILNRYDWVYFVNDSVYGPLWNISPILTDLESRNADLIGMIFNNSNTQPSHIQSWFAGVRKKIATSNFFADFLYSIRAQLTKDDIVAKYEVKLSQIIFQHGYKVAAFYEIHGNDSIYDLLSFPENALKVGIPFIKKRAFHKLFNPLILYSCTSDALIDYIYSNAKRTNLLDKKDIPPYIKSFRFSLFGIPVFCIYRQYEYWAKNTSYKLKLFEKIPVLKISTTKKMGGGVTKMKNNKVVYTCITGGYDDVPKHKYIAPDYDYILFTDNQDLINQGKIYHWTVYPLVYAKRDNVRNNRWHKINAHILFWQYDFSLYLDGNISVLNKNIFDKCQNYIRHNIILSIPRHPERNCIYDEANTVINNNIDHRCIVKRQLRLLRHEHYPPHIGLTENNIIFRQHNQLNTMQDLWWNMVSKFSKRDQLSLMYAVWKTDTDIEYMYPGNHRECGDFKFIQSKNHNQNKVQPYLKIIPKWLGNIICWFILNRDSRHYFRYHFVKGK